MQDLDKIYTPNPQKPDTKTRITPEWRTSHMVLRQLAERKILAMAFLRERLQKVVSEFGFRLPIM